MAGAEQMNHALNELVKSISERGVSPTDRWLLIAINETFRCMPAGHGRPVGTILAKFNDTQLRRGLSPKEWYRITKEITRYYRMEDAE